MRSPTLARSAVAAAAAILLSGTACSTSGSRPDAVATCDAPGVTPDRITLGFVYSDSGGAGSAFSSARAGFDARISLANAEGGVHGRRIAYQWRDDESSDTVNTNVTESLIRAGSVFGLVLSSAVTGGSLDYLTREGVPVTGLAAEPAWAGHTNMFSYMYSASPKIIGRYIQAGGGRKVALVTSGQSAFSSDIVATYSRDLQALGLTAVAVIPYSAASGAYRRDLLALALRREPGDVERIMLPTVTDPEAVAGRGDAAAGWGHLLLGPGCGDNAGAALGLDLRPGEALMSLGTSGVVAAVATAATRDATGTVAGFADATGHHLPLACTLNASRVLDATGALLGVDHDELSRLALSARPGAAGLVFVPYLEGERTPNLPTATGSLYGLTPASMTPANLARAAVEGVLCLLAGCLDALRDQGVRVDRVVLVGGGARSRAVQEIAPAILGVPVAVPVPGEYVADGAARQAARVLARSNGGAPPSWPRADAVTRTAQPLPLVLRRYREAAAAVAATVGSRRGPPASD
ncbi:ABC transporter substrate-binding protein [Parafrankia discariae]|uniref:ABC transporter substrate-binding protein n=1 Tax=Parafrankia discariae TaxID=365528 RepID=UPI0003A7C471|nr:ABC transporter substrate-binding protein [Parafrankia discariae]